METGHVNRNFAIDGGLREEARVISPAQWSLVILKIFSPSPLPLLPPVNDADDEFTFRGAHTTHTLVNRKG